MHCPDFHFRLIRFFVSAIQILMLCAVVYLTITPTADADTLTTPGFNFGTTVEPTIQITLNGDTNQYGRQTLFSGSGVNFGPVTFTHPSLIANGDAYLEEGNLMLEAILSVDIVYSGLMSVNLDLSKIVGSTHPFNKCYYATTKVRERLSVEVLTEPQFNRLATLLNPGSVTLRMVFEVSPRQSGVLEDRFRLIATSS